MYMRPRYKVDQDNGSESTTIATGQAGLLEGTSSKDKSLALAYLIMSTNIFRVSAIKEIEDSAPFWRSWNISIEQNRRPL